MPRSRDRKQGSDRRPPHQRAPGRRGSGRTVADLGEFALIDRLTALVPPAGPGVIAGIGDDAAVLQLSGAVLATCDVQVEGVHFNFALCSPADVGWRSLAVNLSDIAAMGGTPRHALVSLVLPPETETARLDGVYAGLAEAASAHGVAIAGGNVARTSGPLVIDITLLGEAATPIRRTGARSGDSVWVTGSVGKAAAGLFLLRHPEVDLASRDDLVAAYRRPAPRVAIGQALAASGRVTAMVDTSDGTAADLLHLLDASNAGVVLDTAALPWAAGMKETAHAAGLDPAAWALGGGEDYELLFTAAPAFEEAAQDLARRSGVPLTRIGTVLPAAEGRWFRRPDGRRTALAPTGWDHFG
jgi:thiamine-monophosphate kinase